MMTPLARLVKVARSGFGVWLIDEECFWGGFLCLAQGSDMSGVDTTSVLNPFSRVAAYGQVGSDDRFWLLAGSSQSCRSVTSSAPRVSWRSATPSKPLHTIARVQASCSALARDGRLRHRARLLRNQIIMREGRHGDVPSALVGKAF